MTLQKHHLDSEVQSAMMLQSRKCEQRFPLSPEKVSVWCYFCSPVLVTTRVLFSDTEHTLPIKASGSSHYEVSILQNRSIQRTCGQEAKCFKKRWVTVNKHAPTVYSSQNHTFLKRTLNHTFLKRTLNHTFLIPEARRLFSSLLCFQLFNLLC